MIYKGNELNTFAELNNNLLNRNNNKKKENSKGYGGDCGS